MLKNARGVCEVKQRSVSGMIFLNNFAIYVAFIISNDVDSCMLLLRLYT